MGLLVRRAVGYADRAFNKHVHTAVRSFIVGLNAPTAKPSTLRQADGLNSHFFHADSTAFGYCGLPRLPL